MLKKAEKPYSFSYILKIKTLMLFTFVVFLYSILSYFTIHSHFKNIHRRYSNYFSSIEHGIYESIANAEYLVYGLANLLSENQVINNRHYVEILIRSFNPDNRNYNDVVNTMVDIILVDNQANILANTSFPKGDFYKYLGHKFELCIKESNNNFLQLNILPIRNAESNYNTAELIIPINMPFSNNNRERLGILCSGIRISSLNNKLKLLYEKEDWVTNIKLVNLDDNNTSSVNSLDSLLSPLTMVNILSSNSTIVIYKQLLKYPFKLKVEIKTEAFIAELRDSIIHYFSYLAIILFFAYFFLKVVKDTIQEPIYIAHKKLHMLVKTIGKVPIEIIKETDTIALQSFDPDQFCIDVDKLINHCYSLDFNECNRYVNQTNDEIKLKLLNMILKEEKFLPFMKVIPNDKEKLYLNKLFNLIEEEKEICYLPEFLEQTIAYCSNFYEDLSKIKIIIENKDYRNFICKKSVLCETIFLIFTFILKDKCNMIESEFIIKASFDEGKDLPKIKLELHNYVGMASALSWYSGPSYVYVGLLPIFILATKNNYFFDIKEIDEKLCFILDPIN